ncbi:hypothetical protein D3C72_1064480 [compost metagenome]
MFQLAVQHLATGKDIFIAILLAEPVVDLGASTAGGDITEVRVQPVAAWVRLLLGDDFNLVSHPQLVGKGHDAAANFGTDATVADVAVNMISEVERRRAGRQIHHVAFRGKYINPIVEHLAANLVEHLAGVRHLFLPGDQFAQPGDTFLVA